MVSSPARAAHGSLDRGVTLGTNDDRRRTEIERLRTAGSSRAERDAAKALREASHQALLRTSPATADDARLSGASLRQSGRRIAGVLSTACPVHECEAEPGEYCFDSCRGFHSERWAASMELAALGSAS